MSHLKCQEKEGSASVHAISKAGTGQQQGSGSRAPISHGLPSSRSSANVSTGDTTLSDAKTKRRSASWLSTVPLPPE